MNYDPKRSEAESSGANLQNEQNIKNLISNLIFLTNNLSSRNVQHTHQPYYLINEDL
jgi:hypothetical protein